jgi:hypothetical protein
MTALQGKIAVAATASVLTALMLRQAVGGMWVEFFVTETQVLTAMAASWWVLSGR